MKLVKIVGCVAVGGLLVQASSHAEVKVTTEHIPNERASREFAFRKIAPPVKGDAAEQGKFTVISGERDPNGATVEALRDGKLPGMEDQPGENFFFQAQTKGGRLLLDLGRAVEVARVNSYSWHPSGRGPQVYKLYGSSSAEPGEVAEGNPAERGWQALGEVKTASGDNPGGQHGASVAAGEGSLGTFRYLLFDISNTDPDDPFSNTFYSEIDVVEAGKNPEAISVEGGEGKRITFSTAGEKYNVTIDATGTPDLVPWIEQELVPAVKEWYPKIVEMLPSEGYEAPEQVLISFEPDMRGVANASGTRIRCAGEWFRRNLDGEAKGAVIHELVHVVQQYGRGRRNNPDATRTPGWIVEGIPDYIRWFLYEPETKGAEITARNIDRARFDANYRITGNFLNWVVQQHGQDLIRKLNAAAREARYTPEIWKELTGKTVEELGEAWREEAAAKLAGS